jgi:hypothetical protein
VQLKLYPIIGFALLSLTLAQAQNVDVTAHVTVQANAGSGAAHHKDSPTSAGVVVWLVPMQPDSRPATNGHTGPFRLLQKDKMFTPHLLVVPTGSSVEFPNQDPFFHNVFSLFNGKRFDLGLYDSGTSRAVHFDREGVSYIFCNIPQKQIRRRLSPEPHRTVLNFSRKAEQVPASLGITLQREQE